jgi:tight adherence protein B
MSLIAIIVFVAVCSVVALFYVATNGSNKEVRQTLERLSTLAMETANRAVRDEVLDIRRQELLSQIPWLNRILLKISVAPQVRLLLYQAESSWTVGTLFSICGLMGLAVWFGVQQRTGATLLALALGAGASTLPYLFVVKKRSMRFNNFEEKLPETLDLMVSALRAGHGLISALGMVSKDAPEPIQKEFKQLFDEQNYGLELRLAMLNLAQRVPLHDVKIMVTAIVIQRESGGNLAEILDRCAYLIRERFRLKRQISVHTAQGRLTGWILAMLPVVLGLLVYFVNPDYISILWKTEVGLHMMYAAAIMTSIGALIIRKIVSFRF